MTQLERGGELRKRQKEPRTAATTTATNGWEKGGKEEGRRTAEKGLAAKKVERGETSGGYYSVEDARVCTSASVRRIANTLFRAGFVWTTALGASREVAPEVNERGARNSQKATPFTLGQLRQPPRRARPRVWLFVCTPPFYGQAALPDAHAAPQPEFPRPCLSSLPWLSGKACLAGGQGRKAEDDARRGVAHEPGVLRRLCVRALLVRRDVVVATGGVVAISPRGGNDQHERRVELRRRLLQARLHGRGFLRARVGRFNGQKTRGGRVCCLPARA